MDCMSCTGPHRVPDQSNVIGCPASCSEKGLKPVLLLAHANAFDTLCFCETNQRYF